MTRRIWTAEKVDKFAALLAVGTAIRECGRLLRVGESAAIGKAFRLRALGDERFVSDRHSALNRPRKKRKSRADAAPPQPPTPTPPRPPAASAKRAPIRIAWADPRQLDLRIDPCGKRLWDLEAGECHFLIGSMDYCARPVQSGSHRPYCACHRRMMYRAAPRRAA